MWPSNKKTKVIIPASLVPRKGQPGSGCCNAKMYMKKHPIFNRTHVICGHCYNILRTDDANKGQPVEPNEKFPRTPPF